MTSREPRRRFLAILAVILVVAAGVRVVFILGEARHDERVYDAAYYELQARVLVDGQGWVDPFSDLAGQEHRAGEAADHPPLTVLALVPGVWITDGLGMDAESSQLVLRFEVALFGLLVVLLVGLLGREVAGDLAGLIAAGIAAVYPYLWVNDGLLMSETFAATAVAAALLITVRLARREQPGLLEPALLGVACGVAALARAELLLLAPLLGLPLLATFHALPMARRLAVVGCVAAGAVVVVAPWIGFNLSRFDEPTLISSNDGIALRGSNCDPVYSGRAIGLTDLERCIPRRQPPGDQSVVSRRYRQDAIDYIRDGHEARFLLVEAARVGRSWGLYRPADMLSWNESEGRPRWVTATGMVFYYPLLALAIGGVVVLRRRGVRQWPLLMPAVVVTVGTLFAYGQTRFRVPAEPSIVVLAAVPVAALATRVRDQSRMRVASSSR